MKKTRIEHLRELGLELNALLAASRAITAASAERFHPKLQPAAFQIATILSARGSATGRQLSEQLYMDKSAVSRLLKSLCDLGLTESVTDPDDRRSTIYRLTQEGRSRLEASITVKVGAFHARTDGWSEAELIQFTGLLRKFNRHE
ncbi:MarR family winged helix-turn-helix transcriptional regulator [Rhizobium sp. ZW T2_16]|uniref:MarR family winged helix-turn-helix transcriptional regulator n=1 Tax=Rhizobium sp. ZW T2_16 TaxID=3378083 RepID=UPI000FABF107